MDPNIDTSKRKPRQTKGTPSYKYRNRFAVACIVTGIAFFAAFSLSPAFQKVNAKLYEQLCTETEEQRARRYFFSLPAPRRGEAILKAMEEEKERMAEQSN